MRGIRLERLTKQNASITFVVHTLMVVHVSETVYEKAFSSADFPAFRTHNNCHVKEA